MTEYLRDRLGWEDGEIVVALTVVTLITIVGLGLIVGGF